MVTDVAISLLVAFFLFRAFIGATSTRAMGRIFFEGDFEGALRSWRFLAWFYGKDSPVPVAIAAYGHMGLGQVEPALSAAESLLRNASAKRSADAANHIVNTFISAGRYREALAVPSVLGMSESYGLPGRHPLAALLRINLAEAHYNLGEWQAAWGVMEDLDNVADRLPITHDGLRIQRAWILAHQGKGNEALDLLEKVTRSGIPPVYRSETWFCRAAANLALGDLPRAQRAVTEGLEWAKRAPSLRNGLFMMARVVYAQGDAAKADSLCREAAGHLYKGQGGDGLLFWGDVLEGLGRTEDAREAWHLAVDRDPQSESAKRAEERLLGQASQLSGKEA